LVESRYVWYASRHTGSHDLAQGIHGLGWDQGMHGLACIGWEAWAEMPAYGTIRVQVTGWKVGSPKVASYRYKGNGIARNFRNVWLT